MTKETAKALIVEEVTAMQGCKTLELLARESLRDTFVNSSSCESFVESVEELVEEGQLIEVEYTLPNMWPPRIKSFLLPVGTVVHVQIAETN
jgi:hypothetical protein